MIACEERNETNPMCPHCKQPIQKLWYRQLEGFLGKRYVYFCSACRAVLGISHRKGFWMG